MHRFNNAYSEVVLPLPVFGSQAIVVRYLFVDRAVPSVHVSRSALHGGGGRSSVLVRSCPVPFASKMAFYVQSIEKTSEILVSYSLFEGWRGSDFLRANTPLCLYEVSFSFPFTLPIDSKTASDTSSALRRCPSAPRWLHVT